MNEEMNCKPVTSRVLTAPTPECQERAHWYGSDDKPFLIDDHYRRLQ